MKLTLALCFALLAAAPAVAQTGPVAGLGQQAQVTDDVSIVPIAVIEDSRCPITADCIWAGRLVLAARVTIRDKTTQAVLTLGAPQAVGKGQLTLETVTPERNGAAISPQDYRFAFRYLPKPTDRKGAKAR